MKKLLTFALALVLALSLVAGNTTSSSKGYMVDATGGWWYSTTSNITRQVFTIDYVKGDGTSIILTAGCRFTNDDALISTTTYLVPIISAAGVATSDPVTISTAGSYVFGVVLPASADRLYVKVEYVGGTTATVNINGKPDVAN